MPAAAVAEAGNVTDKHLVGAERMAVRAPYRRLGDPLAASSDQITGSHGVIVRSGSDAGFLPVPSRRSVYRTGY
jgi:hypothetical protein